MTLNELDYRIASINAHLVPDAVKGFKQIDPRGYTPDQSVVILKLETPASDQPFKPDTCRIVAYQGGTSNQSRANLFESLSLANPTLVAMLNAGKTMVMIESRTDRPGLIFEVEDIDHAGSVFAMGLAQTAYLNPNEPAQNFAANRPHVGEQILEMLPELGIPVPADLIGLMLLSKPGPEYFEADGSFIPLLQTATYPDTNNVQGLIHAESFLQQESLRRPETVSMLREHDAVLILATPKRTWLTAFNLPHDTMGEA